MTPSVAFVGAGPTTLYALQALLDQGVGGTRIVVFEAQDQAGQGTPYRRGWNDPAMLANIASAEIPPLGQTLLEWLQSRTEAELETVGVPRRDLHDRAFVSRLAIGRYFEDGLEKLAARARMLGNAVEVQTGARVVDAANRPGGLELTVVSDGRTAIQRFDHAVLATGHQWPSRQEPRPGYLTSPWPASGLDRLPATRIGIRGSSLTAIDAAVALALAHGAFRRRGGALVYEAGPDVGHFSLTMLSRKGVLPEADFYFPLPHPPLAICTPDAIRHRIAEGGPGLLDGVFDLFWRELQAADPAWAAVMGVDRIDLETFHARYFAPRVAAGPFAWAEANLAEARANHASRTTVAWRDAILRMHEGVALVVPHLDDPAFQRFTRFFKPVIVDIYAAVPHESVERLLALHRAGRLDVVALGDDDAVDTHAAEGGAVVTRAGQRDHFPVFIEATGQRPLGAIQFPFLTLIEQGLIRDREEADGEDSRGLLLDEVFQPVAPGLPPGRLFCVSLPFLLGRHPFAQGLTSSRDMGQVVGRRLASVLRDAAEGRGSAKSAA